MLQVDLQGSAFRKIDVDRTKDVQNPELRYEFVSSIGVGPRRIGLAIKHLLIASTLSER